jgi:hypothetical protein
LSRRPYAAHKAGVIALEDERQRVLAVEVFEGKVTALYQGDLPDMRAKVKGMRPARAAYQNFLVFHRVKRDELRELEGSREKVLHTIAAPAAIEAERAGLIQRMSKRFLEFVAEIGLDAEQGEYELNDRRQLDRKLDNALHRADVARESLSKIDEKIQIARLQVNCLAGREKEFRNAALLEHVAAELGDQYLKQIEALRSTMHQLFGLRDQLGLSGIDRVELPTFGLAAPAKHKTHVIARDRATNPSAQWDALVKSWQKSAG